MSWYYVDKEGQTQGGFEVSVLKQKYTAKQLDEESYVWNGTSVNQWTPLKQVNELMSQLKTAAAPSRPSRPARRKSPFGGGGGRANFLASIQKGATLKKVEPKKESDKPAPKSGGGGGGGGGMDLMSQLRAKQNAMKKKGTIGGAKKAGGGAKTGPAKSGPRPSGGPKKTWGKPSTTSTTSPKKTWGKPSSGPSKSYGGSSGGGTSSARITKIKNKLDSAQEWQLKAIEKILS